MRVGLFLSFLLFASCAGPSSYSPLPQKMIVDVAVLDVRSDNSLRNNKYEYDPNQETQLLQGEAVIVHEKKGKWARVECLDQLEFTHNSKWEGYPGWVLLKGLGSDISKEKKHEQKQWAEEEFREKLLLEARHHLGSPYLWGGRSLHDTNNKNVLTGVDCSGLVNWSFLQLGRFIPRDAHEQFMKARRVFPGNLKKADLIFLAKKEKPEKIVHVGFYAGEDQLLEAPQSGEKVRQISFHDRFGKSLSELENGSVVGDRVIYFGTLIEGEL